MFILSLKRWNLNFVPVPLRGNGLACDLHRSHNRVMVGHCAGAHGSAFVHHRAGVHRCSDATPAPVVAVAHVHLFAHFCPSYAMVPIVAPIFLVVPIAASEAHRCTGAPLYADTPRRAGAHRRPMCWRPLLCCAGTHRCAGTQNRRIRRCPSLRRAWACRQLMYRRPSSINQRPLLRHAVAHGLHQQSWLCRRPWLLWNPFSASAHGYSGTHRPPAPFTSTCVNVHSCAALATTPATPTACAQMKRWGLMLPAWNYVCMLKNIDRICNFKAFCTKILHNKN